MGPESTPTLVKEGLKYVESWTAVWRWALLGAALATTACAGRPAHLNLPSGTGQPWPGATEAWTAATAECRGIRTISAELALSGRVGQQAIRARALVGLAPDAVRLEGLAPFGPPAFILVSPGQGAILLLPRDPAVLRARDAAPILEALVGIPLGADDLKATLTGCVLPRTEARGGRTFDAATAAVDLAGGATVFLRRQPDGLWRIFAARREGWQVEYAWGAARVPDRVRLWKAQAGTPAVDVSAALSQVDINVDLGAEVFRVEVPTAARPITLDDVRVAGPLGEKGTRHR